MHQEYYALPLTADAIMRQKEHQKCSLRQSVAQQLHLLLTTAFGEAPAEESFGCNIWEHDFDNLTGSTRLNEVFRQSLLISIQQQEKRISNVRVEAGVRQEELADSTDASRIKKRMDITIYGILQTTNETFTYNDSFFIGPLSY